MGARFQQVNSIPCYRSVPVQWRLDRSSGSSCPAQESKYTSRDMESQGSALTEGV